MRIAAIVSLLAAGFLAGWFTRELTRPGPERHTARRDAERRPETVPSEPDGEGEAGETLPGEQPTGPGDSRSSPTAPEAEEQTGPETGDAATEEDPIAKWVRAQSVQWKAWASMQAGQRIESLLKELGFDEETAKLIEEAIAEEAERQTERAIQMFLGEEDLDANAFGYFMGLPPELSTELERELATFLNDSEIDSLRGGFKEAYDKQVRDMADMQIGMMNITDLTADQRDKVRDVFTSKDLFKEQMTQFAEVTRDRTTLRALMTGDIDLEEAMKENLAPTRKRMRDILTPTQFERYQGYEKMLIQQAEMGMKMFAGMLEQSAKPKEPAR